MILCLDYGARYIGVAITDADERLGLRHSVIDQKQENALLTITNIIQTEGIQKIIVGLPVSLEGHHTLQTQETTAFIEKLQQQVGEQVAIEPVDETLTSVEAAQRIKIEGLPHSEEHTEAARLILEDYLRQKE